MLHKSKTQASNGRNINKERRRKKEEINKKEEEKLYILFINTHGPFPLYK